MEIFENFAARAHSCERLRQSQLGPPWNMEYLTERRVLPRPYPDTKMTLFWTATQSASAHVMVKRCIENAHSPRG